ncbi:MAG: TonB-dependent receptor, partial [Novosphingobium sp.]
MRKIALMAFVSSIALSAAPAMADAGNAGSSDNSTPNDEIVVTATRSETLLSKTPIAVTAITGDSLKDKGIVGPTGLAETVPNLSIDRTNGLQVTIRGVTSTDGTEKGNPSAAFLIDGIYLARPQEADVGFFDVQRVEVLRGPQGTLYGRNTTAGVINVITNKPSFDGFGAGLNASYGNYNAASVDGFVNVAAGDSAAFRLSATYDRRDSWILNAPGDTVPKVPFRQNFSVRGQAMFKLGDRGDLLLRGSYGHLGGSRQVNLPTSNFYSQNALGTASTVDANGNAIWNPISKNVTTLMTRNLKTIPISSTWGGGVSGRSDPFLVD